MYVEFTNMGILTNHFQEHIVIPSNTNHAKEEVHWYSEYESYQKYKLLYHVWQYTNWLAATTLISQKLKHKAAEESKKLDDIHTWNNKATTKMLCLLPWPLNPHPTHEILSKLIIEEWRQLIHVKKLKR